MATTYRVEVHDGKRWSFGLKRRARRARGWRIEQRQRFQSFFNWTMNRVRDKAAGLRSKPIGPTTRLGNVEIPTCIGVPHTPERLPTFAEARRRSTIVVLEDEAFAMDWELSEEAAKAEIAAETERWRKLIDPSMGEPWEEKADA